MGLMDMLRAWEEAQKVKAGASATGGRLTNGPAQPATDTGRGGGGSTTGSPTAGSPAVPYGTQPNPPNSPPGPISPSGQFGIDWTTPSNIYQSWKQHPYMGEENRDFTRMEGGRLPPVYWNNIPGSLGMAWTSYLMGDPYNRMITDAGERDAMSATNTAFDTARNKMRTSAFGAGAEDSGVARGVGRQMEVSRGQALSDDVRNWEQFKINKGDERLRNLWLPWLQQYNNAVATGYGIGGGGGGGGGSGWEDLASLVTTAAGIYAAFGCWVAEELFGPDAHETQFARYWILTKSPRHLRGLYLENGRELAHQVKTDPELRSQLIPLFKSIALHGALDLEASRLAE